MQQGEPRPYGAMAEQPMTVCLRALRLRVGLIGKSQLFPQFSVPVLGQ